MAEPNDGNEEKKDSSQDELKNAQEKKLKNVQEFLKAQGWTKRPNKHEYFYPEDHPHLHLGLKDVDDTEMIGDPESDKGLKKGYGNLMYNKKIDFLAISGGKGDTQRAAPFWCGGGPRTDNLKKAEKIIIEFAKGSCAKNWETNTPEVVSMMNKVEFLNP